MRTSSIQHHALLQVGTMPVCNQYGSELDWNEFPDNEGTMIDHSPTPEIPSNRYDNFDPAPWYYLGTHEVS